MAGGRREIELEVDQDGDDGAGNKAPAEATTAGKGVPWVDEAVVVGIEIRAVVPEREKIAALLGVGVVEELGLDMWRSRDWVGGAGG